MSSRALRARLAAASDVAMRGASIERFVLGYGAQGYQILARSAGLSRDLERDCLNEAARWEVADDEGSYVVTPLADRSPGARVLPHSGGGEGGRLLAFAARRVAPRERQRGYIEKAFAVATWSGGASCVVDVSALLRALPAFDARGKLAIASADPQPVHGERAELSRGQSARWSAWLALMRGGAVALSGSTRRDALAFCASIFNLLPPEARLSLSLGLGLTAAPPERSQAGLFQLSGGRAMEGAIEVSLGDASAARIDAGDALGAWFLEELLPAWESEPSSAAGRLDALWERMREDAAVCRLDLQVIQARVEADRLGNAAREIDDFGWDP